MKRISVLVLMIGTLILALSLSLGILSPPFLTGFLTSRAQTSWDSKFWVFNGQMVDFVKLINRGIEEGRSEATLLGQGEGKSGIGIGLPDGSSSTINGRDGMHVSIKDPELAVPGGLGTAGEKTGEKGRGYSWQW